MYLILKGLAEEWKPVKNLLTKKIEDIEKMFYQHYNLLCNDKIFLSNDIKKLLKCRYVHHDIPFLKIAPFKEEDIYLEPRVVMFHDVISEEEIDTMKDMSKHMVCLVNTVLYKIKLRSFNFIFYFLASRIRSRRS